MFYEVLMEKRAQREHSEFMYKLAHFDDLTPMEKVAILKQLKKGYKYLGDKADQASWKATETYLKGLNKVGLDPMEAHDIMEGAAHAGLYGGGGAAAKNAILGTAIKKFKQGKGGDKLKRIAKAVDATANEGAGVGGMLGRNKNLAGNFATYHARPSLEGLVDGVSNIVSSAI